MMQKFCNFAGWLEDVGCRNSAQPYFSRDSLLYRQQMDDAEILHLNSVAEILHNLFYRLILYLIYNK